MTLHCTLHPSISRHWPRELILSQQANHVCFHKWWVGQKEFSWKNSPIQLLVVAQQRLHLLAVVNLEVRGIAEQGGTRGWKEGSGGGSSGNGTCQILSPHSNTSLPLLVLFGQAPPKALAWVQGDLLSGYPPTLAYSGCLFGETALAPVARWIQHVSIWS